MSMPKALALCTAAALLTVSPLKLQAQRAPAPQVAQPTSAAWRMPKGGVELDLRSTGRRVADEVRTNRLKTVDAPLAEPLSEEAGSLEEPVVEQIRGNTQVNDPNLDHIQRFPGRRPYVLTTNSETSVAAFGRNIVATYNTAAGARLVRDPATGELAFDRLFLSGLSTSADGGRTWRSGFMPPLPGSIFTFGDPVIDVDRRGTFFFTGLGADAAGRSTIQVNRSTNGRTFSRAFLVQQDDGADKPWLAVGPDPVQRDRDNVYVAWASYQISGIQLRLGRSTDGGRTWSTRIIFAPEPDPDPEAPQNFVQFTNPVVDRATGRLYVPFVHFSFVDQDYIRILISDDAGRTFRFARFNVPGAPSPTLLPITQPGHLTECGADLVEPPPPDTAFFAPDVRLTIHDGRDVGGSFTGLPRYRRASRLIVQPAMAAYRGVLFLAWSNSTSQIFGDPTSGSNVLFIRSDDGGRNWTRPVRVNPAGAEGVQHVLPALSIRKSNAKGGHVTGVDVLYYTQHGDGRVSVDLASSSDQGHSFPAANAQRVSTTRFGLAPTNIPIPTRENRYDTTNYDRLIRECYSLGEYLSVTSQNNTLYALWGDSRNFIRQPVSPLDPISGRRHPQEDVFFQALEPRTALPTIAEDAQQGRVGTSPKR